jgi:transposase
MLLPECLDDFIDESNPVRVIDVFVDALDLAEMGFEGVEPAATGRPSYHPSVLLKLYIYGYLNRVHPKRTCAGYDAPREGDISFKGCERLIKTGKAHDTT